MELLKGKHLVPKSSKDFLRICKTLGKFTGIMRLLGDIDGNFCRADLLVDNGYVIAASFENITKREIIFKGSALTRIKDRFIGSTGSLEIYKFDKNELNSTKKENTESLLSSPVDITALGVRVKSMGKKKVVEEKGPGILERLSAGVPISRFSREEKFEIEKRLREPQVKKELESRGVKANIEGLTKVVKGMQGVDLQALKKKIEIKEELKRRRQETDRKIADKFSKIGKTKEEEKKKVTIQKGVIKTSIDKLFELVKRYNKLKINDSLARRLNVSRSQIEEWSIILEDHNLVELRYPTLGDPEVRVPEKK